MSHIPGIRRSFALYAIFDQLRALWESSLITLYQFGNSVCCQKVRITLSEKRLDWESVEVDLFRSEQYDPDYLKLNPKGVVPTLVHDGQPLIEPPERGDAGGFRQVSDNHLVCGTAKFAMKGHALDIYAAAMRYW